jgi:HK97 family phage prohead protease
MPWHVGEQGSHGCDGYPVVKDDSGEVEGCHDTREAANRQVAALYASENGSGRAEMAAKSINDLPDSAFAYIEPGGSKDDQGKTVPRSKRHFPIHDAAHVRNALARAPQSPFGAKAMPKIRAAAKKFGIEVGDRSSTDGVLTRTHTADLSLRGDGRTIHGIVMPYGEEARVNDGYGFYTEVFRQGAFAKSVRERGDRIKLLVNHEKYKQLPIGRSLTFKEEKRGLYGEFRVSDTAAGNEALVLVRDGVADSFSAGFVPINPGPHEPVPQSGIVERVEAKLGETSLVAFPAYAGAAVIGVRSALIEIWDELSPEEQEATRHLDLPALIRTAAQQHVADTPSEADSEVTEDEAVERAADEEEPTTDADQITSDGHSPPYTPTQRPTKSLERIHAEMEAVKARVAAAISKEMR